MTTWRLPPGSDELVGKIQERYGIAREDAERQVSDWERNL